MGCFKLTYGKETGVLKVVHNAFKINVKSGSDADRYGYQGEFAECDPETATTSGTESIGGWNSFDLRMYDSNVGRWLSPDPKKQYWSPYEGMGNNPINLIDPDGGGTDGWYTAEGSGEMTYDKNINSQEDLKNAGISGTYHGPSPVGFNSQGDWTQFHADGTSSAASDYVDISVSPKETPMESFYRTSGLTSNPYSPTQFFDAIYVSVGGNFYPGGGAGKNFMLVMGAHGFQLYGNVHGGLGNDVSAGLGFGGINFERRATWRNDLTGNFFEGEVGALGFSASHSENFDRDQNVHGNYTNSYGVGVSFGSDQLPVGVVNARASAGYTYRINAPWQK